MVKEKRFFIILIIFIFGISALFLVSCEKDKATLGKELIGAVTFDKAKELIEKGADLNYKDLFDNTSLHLSAKRGDIELTKLLIDKGANVNLQNKDGFTPLHWAVTNNKLEIVKLLIENGKAEINIKSAGGLTPYKIATGSKMIEYLKSKGAKE